MIWDVIRDYSVIIMACGGAAWASVAMFFSMRQSVARAHQRIDLHDRQFNDLVADIRRYEERADESARRIEDKIDRIIERQLDRAQ